MTSSFFCHGSFPIPASCGQRVDITEDRARMKTDVIEGSSCLTSTSPKRDELSDINTPTVKTTTKLYLSLLLGSLSLCPFNISPSSMDFFFNVHNRTVSAFKFTLYAPF